MNAETQNNSHFAWPMRYGDIPLLSTLSSKGQVIILKILRSRYKWDIGQALNVIDTGEGILLRSSRPFKKTELDEVAGVLKYSGKPVSLDEMEKAIKPTNIPVSEP